MAKAVLCNLIACTHYVLRGVLGAGACRVSKFVLQSELQSAVPYEVLVQGHVQVHVLDMLMDMVEHSAFSIRFMYYVNCV